MLKWMILLLSFLRPAVEADIDDPDPDDLDPADPDDPDPDDLDPADPDDLDPQDPDNDPEPAPRISRAQQEIIGLRKRAQEAEEKASRALVEAESFRRSQPKQETADDILYKQEEERLKDPALEDWQRYAINSARASREAKRDAQGAVAFAQDMADKASFDQLSLKNPTLYKKYSDKVEEFKKQPGSPKREIILALLIGKDTLDGNIKSTTKSSTKNGGADRGSSVRVRSDVRANQNGMSTVEKAKKRLDALGL